MSAAASPAPPAGYAWEATDEQVSERYGVDPSAIVRFDLNTSLAPPDVALRALRSGAYGRPISEYPPSDYRDLVAAAADVYGVGRDELLVGAGADEILDTLATCCARISDSDHQYSLRIGRGGIGREVSFSLSLDPRASSSSDAMSTKE